MQQVMTVLRDILRFHKMKIVSIFVFALIFGVLIFPYNDLGSILTDRVYEGSQRQVYLTADNFNLSLFPIPGLKASGVSVEPGESARFAPIQLESLGIRPALTSLLAFRYGASVDGTGFLGGTISGAGSTLSSLFTMPPTGFQVSDVKLTDVTLPALLAYIGEMTGTPIHMKVGGKLSAEAESVVYEPAGKNPLKGDVSVTLQNITLPTSIPLASFGALDIPQVRLTNAKFDTRLVNTKLQIVNGTFGSAKDPISGTVLGEIDFTPGPFGLTAGPYDVCLELNMTQAFYDQLLEKVPVLRGFSSVTERYRRQGSPGVSYAMVFSPRAPIDPQFGARLPMAGDCRNKRGGQ